MILLLRLCFDLCFGFHTVVVLVVAVPHTQVLLTMLSDLMAQQIPPPHIGECPTVKT